MGTSPGSPAGAWGVTPTPAPAIYPPALGYTTDRVRQEDMVLGLEFSSFQLK